MSVNFSLKLSLVQVQIQFFPCEFGKEKTIHSQSSKRFADEIAESFCRYLIRESGSANGIHNVFCFVLINHQWHMLSFGQIDIIVRDFSNASLSFLENSLEPHLADESW